MSESDSDSGLEVIDLRKTREKGIRRVDEHKRSVLKKARLSGDSVVTGKGVVIPQKNNDNSDAVKVWALGQKNMPKSDGDSDYQPDSEDFSDEEDIGSPTTLTTQEITDILLENGLRIRTPKISKKVSFTPLLCESETIEDIPCSVIVDGVLQDLPAVTVSSTISTVTYAFYDSIPHQEESQRQVKRQKVAETKKKQ
ncbi:hypothetical protein GE061_015827 [Apolygus lucorum]|uniref:Uncharacterized protein n=1 Tax=Apolygus lucorum TaxID=248454 RepID=A0A8S9XP52_APOLU|nr:hypothetical protein GE061_015827 [Apolygus lucorum]